jgi:nitroreductase
MNKPADTAFPIHDLMRARWSPRAFSDRKVTSEELRSLLEAARWAPSCFNEQPWSFLVGRKGTAAFDRLASCLVEANRGWAAEAGALVLAVTSRQFRRNGKPNRHAEHDLGLALGQFGLQATALGLGMHQMAGFDVESARGSLKLPDGQEPVTMVAVGWPGEAASLPEALAERERAPRERRAQEEFVFGGEWGRPMDASGDA